AFWDFSALSAFAALSSFAFSSAMPYSFDSVSPHAREIRSREKSFASRSRELLFRKCVAGSSRDPLALAVLREPHAHAHALARLRVIEHDVRQVDRRLLLEDAALLRLAARPRVALHEVHLLHDDPALRLVHRQDAAGLPLVVTGDHHDGVAL